MMDNLLQKDGVPISATVVLNSLGMTAIYIAPNCSIVEIDEILVTDLSGNPNNEITLEDSFNLATTGAPATNPKGVYRINTANGFLQFTDIPGAKFLNQLQGQTSLGPARITIRGRER